jgi:L-threonylcarbamoyladenylate synthase
MESVMLTEQNIVEIAAQATAVLRKGGIILYPTDTLYGLGADALSDTAVEKIYDIKGRDEHKPIHAIVADMQMAERYAEVNENTRKLAEKFGGAVTLILKKKNDITSGIARGLDTFGFRIPNNAFCIALTKNFGGPITATSANKSGAAPMRRVDDILAQLGEDTQQIDLVIDVGELPEREPSTVVDFSNGTLKMLREGAVSAAEIESVVGA